MVVFSSYLEFFSAIIISNTLFPLHYPPAVVLCWALLRFTNTCVDLYLSVELRKPCAAFCAFSLDSFLLSGILCHKLQLPSFPKPWPLRTVSSARSLFSGCFLTPRAQSRWGPQAANWGDPTAHRVVLVSGSTVLSCLLLNVSNSYFQIACSGKAYQVTLS